MVTIKAGTPSHHGKLSWLAGILPRTRWAVSIFYCTLADAEREAVEGVAKRQGDNRPKRGLVPVKRLELACKWFVQQKDAWSCRRIPMQVQLPKYSVTT